jgi:hypothetical protein
MTAVNFLKEKIKKYPELYFAMSLWFDDALELEKCQLIEMHDKGFDSVQQLNDDYAIEFALFLALECETNGDKDGFWYYKTYWKTTNELLEIFKKEKGL